ncbi:MAG: hypothetical protein ACI82S_003408 [Patiriisocius sp.]|jgi:hypothetical protein
MTTHLYTKAFTFLALLILQIQPVFADSFRCNNKVVKAGDTTVEVKIKCGEPFDIENLGNALIQNKFVKIIRYTYVPNVGKLVKILEFQNGELVKIINGPRM